MVIRAEADHRETLRKKVIREQENLAKKENYKREQWRICQNLFQQQRPKVETQLIEAEQTYSIKETEKLNEKERTILVNDIVQVLKQKVIHD